MWLLSISYKISPHSFGLYVHWYGSPNISEIRLFESWLNMNHGSCFICRITWVHTRSLVGTCCSILNFLCSALHHSLPLFCWLWYCLSRDLHVQLKYHQIVLMNIFNIVRDLSLLIGYSVWTFCNTGSFLLLWGYIDFKISLCDEAM